MYEYIYILCTKQICCICKAHAQRMPKDWSRHHMHSSLVALWPWRSEAMTGYSASSPDEVRAKSETKTCPGIKWEGRTGRGRDWETQTGIIYCRTLSSENVRSPTSRKPTLWQAALCYGAMHFGTLAAQTFVTPETFGRWVYFHFETILMTSNNLHHSATCFFSLSRLWYLGFAIPWEPCWATPKFRSPSHIFLMDRALSVRFCPHHSNILYLTIVILL